MHSGALSDASFEAVRQLFRDVSGIELGPPKRALVVSRLQRLAQDRGIADLDRYVALATSGGDPEEHQRLVDKLTTNETYFFREREHFDALTRLAREHRAQGHGEPMRVWSAASSSGEEAYSIAMVLAEALGQAPWEVRGTDLSLGMVQAAARGIYPMERLREVPRALLHRWCLKGEGRHAGHVQVDSALRARVRFRTANLMQPLPESLGRFDVIFLRNVLIYFDPPRKAEIVRRVLGHLKPGGLLFAGHAESLNNLGLPLRTVQPAIYAPPTPSADAGTTLQATAHD